MRGTFGVVMLGLGALLGAAPMAEAQRPPKAAAQHQGPTFEGRTLAEWLKDMKHSDASRRSAAILAVLGFEQEKLSTIEKQSITKALLDRLADRDASPRAKALLVLRFVEVNAADIETVVKALGARIDPLNPNGEAQATIRYEAGRTLTRFVLDAHHVIPQLIKGSQDRASWEIRHQCVSILWRATRGQKGNDSRGIQGMLDLLQNETTFSVRAELLHGLAALGPPTSNPALLSRELSLLRSCAQTPRNPDNKPLVLWALVGLVAVGDGTADARASLSRLSRYVTNPKETLHMRSQAAQAIGSLGDKGKSEVPVLLGIIDDHESLLSQSACIGLSGLGDTSDRVIDALIKTMQHKDYVRAGAAVKALVDLQLHGNTRVLAAMDKLREDKNLDLRLRTWLEDAIKALKEPRPKKAGR
jgi:hypothetical protein